MKIAIVTDSNSGITQKQAQELGVFVLAMPFQIDGETYYEDITLTQEEFYEKLKNDADISTSQPSVGELQDEWDKLLKEYDEIIFLVDGGIEMAGSYNAVFEHLSLIHI